MRSSRYLKIRIPLPRGGCRSRHLRLERRLFINLVGNAMNVPREPEPFHDANHVVGEIDFPPVETVSRRRLIAMMVVVPTFAEANERRQQVVARLVGGVE